MVLAKNRSSRISDFFNKISPFLSIAALQKYFRELPKADFRGYPHHCLLSIGLRAPAFGKQTHSF